MASKLGWLPSGEEGAALFMSELADGESDTWLDELGGYVSCVTIPLTSRAANEEGVQARPIIVNLFQKVEYLLVERYGAPTKSYMEDGVYTSEWELPSGVEMDLSYHDLSMFSSVYSPDYSALLNDPASGPNFDEGE